MRFVFPAATAVLLASPAFAADPGHASDDTVASIAAPISMATSTATVGERAEAAEHSEGGVSYGLSFGTVTSNPWRGDQLATSDRELFWTSEVGIGFGAGPGELGIGFTAVGPYDDSYADFTVPITYAVETGPVTTTAVYEPMPTTYTPGSEVIHELGADVEVAAGPVTPAVGFRVDPTVEQGAYAAAGLGWEQSVGRVTFGAGGSFGVSAFRETPFGAQDVGAGVSTGFDLGGGFGAGVDAAVSYGFRSGDVIPFGGFSLGFER